MENENDLICLGGIQVERFKLIESIIKTTNDYKMPAGMKMSSEHVERWISQFYLNEQIVILEEMNQILKKYYFSRNKVKEYLKSILSNKKAFGEDVAATLKTTTFLSIQTQGNSQKHLLKIVEEILQEDYRINLKECHGTNLYFYIDDCIFTGNKFRYDIVPWINSHKFEQGSKLVTYHLALHNMGFRYASKFIEEAAQLKHLGLVWCRHLYINSIKENNASIETLWPLKVEDINVLNYYNKTKFICEGNGWNSNLYRNQCLNINEVLFSSVQARNIVEGAFLRVGAKLVMAAQNPLQSMRPLGFQKLESLGFGSFFITYRNIANNCPLALWYGDPTCSANHPFSKWYPLFPRNTQTGNTIGNINPKEIEWEGIFNGR